MNDTQQLGPAGRLLFWILGSLLFVVIALLPYKLYMDFADDYTVRTTVLTWVAILLGLVWLGTNYGQLKTSGAPKAKRSRPPILGAGSGPKHTAVRVGFILLQILILPLVILAIIRALAG